MYIRHTSEKWMGVHRGIVCETSNLNYKKGPRGMFAGYIFLNSITHPEIRNFLGTPIDEGTHSHNEFFDQFTWHWGVTFYEESTRGNFIYIKIGHDYSHLGDDRYEYDHDYLLRDLEIIIDEYREIHPEKKSGGND